MGGRGGSSGGSRGGSSGALKRPAERVSKIKNLEPPENFTVSELSSKIFEDAYANARLYLSFVKNADNKTTMPIRLGEQEHVSLDTLRGIQAKINETRARITEERKLGLVKRDIAKVQIRSLDAVQRGLRKTYREHTKYWKSKKKSTNKTTSKKKQNGAKTK